MVSIIAPTIDEAANLPELAERIAASMTDTAYELLIIDDGSQDGTKQVCAELAKRYPLTVHVRQNRTAGLSGAVLHGFSLARGDIFVVMDADLQHPPEALPAITAPILRGWGDFVLGSRWVEGGRIAGDWGPRRRLNSAVARLLAAPLAGPVRDPMSGFFALRREILSRVGPLSPLGYKIALELMCKCRPARIVEIPIEFGLRMRGDSKLAMKQRVSYVRHLFRLYRYRCARRFRSGDPACPDGKPEAFAAMRRREMPRIALAAERRQPRMLAWSSNDRCFFEPSRQRS